MMQKALFAPVVWLLHLMALLPLGVLYGVADVIYLLVYRVGRYRVKVVRKNLADSFPEKTEAELRRIERQFYRNFADYIVETVKLLHISDRTIMKRMEFEGVEQIDSLFDQGRSIVAYFSHCGNWEWAPSVTLHTRHRPEDGVCQFCQVYRPLRNKPMDKLMLRLRSRFGSVSYPKRTVFRDLLRLSREGVLSITGFMSDQKPSHGDDIHVVRFLNHPTAVITGTEQLGRRPFSAACRAENGRRLLGRLQTLARTLQNRYPRDHRRHRHHRADERDRHLCQYARRDHTPQSRDLAMDPQTMETPRDHARQKNGNR